KIGPVIDAFRIAGAYRDNDDRSAHNSAVRSGSPIVSNKTGVDDLIDITFKRKRGDIGFKPADDRARLGAAPLVGLLEFDVFTRLLFPESLKGRDNTLAVSLARSRVSA